LIADFVKCHAAAETSSQKAFFLDIAKQVPFSADNEDGKDSDEGKWSVDGLHMTSAGYDFVGEEVAGFIHNII
jgi:lysophospholipase L1-like esterase